MQAIHQIVALAITLLVAIVAGSVTGMILKVPSLFHPLADTQLFDDGQGRNSTEKLKLVYQLSFIVLHTLWCIRDGL